MSTNPGDAPALLPPPGQVSNFVDPPTLMTSVIVGSVFVLTVMTSFIALRVFTKLYIIREFRVEDYLSVFAWAGVATYTGILIYIEDYGFARHQWDVTVSMYSHMLYYINILYILYAPTTMAAKLSVLYQIKRIFTTGRKDAVYWVTVVSIALNAIFYTGLFFAYIFQCWPREAIWDSSVKGTCTSGVSSDFAAGILNLISDVEALVLPGWAIWHLRMPIKKKLSVFAVFAVGSLAIIIGIVGLYYRVILLSTADFTWVCTKAAMLIISEMAVVVIVGCVPSVPRFRRFLKSGASSARTYPAASSLGPSRSTGKKHIMGTYDHLDPEMAVNKTPKSSPSTEHLEMHSYSNEASSDGTRAVPSPAAGGIWKTTQVQQSVENI